MRPALAVIAAALLLTVGCGGENGGNPVYKGSTLRFP